MGKYTEPLAYGIKILICLNLIKFYNLLRLIPYAGRWYLLQVLSTLFEMIQNFFFFCKCVLTSITGFKINLEIKEGRMSMSNIHGISIEV